MRSPAVVLLVLALGSPAQAAPSEPVSSVVRTHIRRHGPRILRDFAALLEIPNHASDREDIARNVSAIRERLEARRFTVTPWHHDDAPPLIFATRARAENTRTVAIYIHYDGQPVVAERWRQDPFRPTLYAEGRPRPFPTDGQAIDPEWRLHARSAGDDKGPIIALVHALDALDAARIPLTWNLMLLLDGEEEVGSPHLAAYLDAHREALSGVDLWLFCDGPTHQSGRPQLSFGVRGVTGMEVTVFGAARELHSGHYGNWAPVPGNDLAHLLASMKARDGQVRVRGFYDTHAPITKADRAALATAPPVDAALRAELGLAHTEADDAPLGERLLLPSLTIRGLASGQVGAEARNAIPDRAVATLGVRLAQGDDPEHMLDRIETHIREQGFHIVRDEPDLALRRAHRRLAMVKRKGGYRAVRTGTHHPIVKRLVEGLRSVAPELVLNPTMGGSLPLYLFEDRSKAPIVILPIANYDNHQHAPNENLRLGNLWYGMEAYAVLLSRP